MSNRIEIYEACKLWPSEVVLPPNRTYVTLWGDAGGKDDRILSDGRGFLLFDVRPERSGGWRASPQSWGVRTVRQWSSCE